MIKSGTLCLIVSCGDGRGERFNGRICSVVRGPGRYSVIGGWVTGYVVDIDGVRDYAFSPARLRPISDPDADISECGKHPVTVAA